MATTVKTVDHNLIKAFAKARNGSPALIDQNVEGYSSQPLRIHFDEKNNEDDFDLQPVSWEAFFVEMKNRELALAYEEDGDDPYFYEFVPANA